MRIGELAAATGLTSKTIRFYEDVGLLPEPERKPSGYRDYDESAVLRLQFVHAAQAAGLTLAEIREVIAVRQTDGSPCQHVINLLRAHVTELDRRITQLSQLRQDVGRLLERAAGLDPGLCDASSVCQIIPTHAPPPDS